MFFLSVFLFVGNIHYLYFRVGVCAKDLGSRMLLQVQGLERAPQIRPQTTVHTGQVSLLHTKLI